MMGNIRSLWDPRHRSVADLRTAERLANDWPDAHTREGVIHKVRSDRRLACIGAAGPQLDPDDIEATVAVWTRRQACRWCQWHPEVVA